MKLIDGIKLPEVHDLKAMAMAKLIGKNKVKDPRDKEPYTYHPENYYKHHMSMINDFGFRKCFTYAEVVYDLK